jgi:hypothetical protein
LSELKHIIKRLGGAEYEVFKSLKCKVLEVAELWCKCEPLNGDCVIDKAWFNAMAEDANLPAAILTVKPVVGSIVIVTMVNEVDGFVSMVGDIDKVTLKQTAEDGFVFEFDMVNGTAKLGGGENGGLVIASELKTQLDKLTARVDGILDAINSTTVVPVATDGGAAILSLIRAGLALIVEKEDFEALENENVTH